MVRRCSTVLNLRRQGPSTGSALCSGEGPRAAQSLGHPLLARGLAARPRAKCTRITLTPRSSSSPPPNSLGPWQLQWSQSPFPGSHSLGPSLQGSVGALLPGYQNTLGAGQCRTPAPAPPPGQPQHQSDRPGESRLPPGWPGAHPATLLTSTLQSKGGIWPTPHPLERSN